MTHEPSTHFNIKEYKMEFRNFKDNLSWALATEDKFGKKGLWLIFEQNGEPLVGMEFDEGGVFQEFENFLIAASINQKGN